MNKNHEKFRSRNQAGFTLVELIITLTIAAILVTVAVPSFQDVIQNNRVTTQANEFLTALSIARSEALKRGRNVTMTADTAGSWENGWTITDNAGNALFVNNGFEGGSEITSTADTLTYNSRGFLSTGTLITFTLSNSDAATGRIISVSPNGSSKIEVTHPSS